MRSRSRGAIGAVVIAVGAILVLRSRVPDAKPAAPSAAASAHAAAPAPRQPGARARVTAPVRARTATGAAVWSGGWGSGPSELGRSIARESAPMGPMSFLPSTAGRALVLDQVNTRVQLIDQGKVVGSIPIPSETFDDLARVGRDRVALLDRLVAGSVAIVDPSGTTEREIALVGQGVARAGDVTALFSRDDGLWVEVDHDRLVRIADATGAPVSPRTEVAGRFSADGRRLLRARVEADRTVTVTSSPREATDVATITARVAFPLPVLSLAALESDDAGRVFVVATTIEESTSPPFDVTDVVETLVVFDRDLTERRRAALTPKTMPEEQLTRYRVGDDGALYVLSFTDQGTMLRRIEP